MPTSRTPEHQISHNNLPTEDEALHASPSKSRAAAQTARNWSTVTAWLTKLLAPLLVPAFERNDATLSCLLTLVHSNDTANTERALLHQAQVEAFADCKSDSNSHSSPVNDLLLEVNHSLSPTAQSALTALATTSITLGTLPPHTAPSLAIAFTSLTHSSFTQAQQTTRLAALQHSLDHEIAQTHAAIAALHTDDDAASSLRAQTALWARETKHLGLKAAEYRHQISTSNTGGNSPTGPRHADVRALEADIAVRERDVQAQEERVRIYHGLPADVEVAREEVRRAQGELVALQRRREELFGRMMES